MAIERHLPDAPLPDPPGADGDPPGSAARRGRWTARALLAGIGLFHLLTMPAIPYAGDNYAIRAEVASWLETGSLGIPYERRDELGDLLDERGQYFFQNDERQLFFSKYPIGNTLLWAPPVLAERLFAGDVPLLSCTDSQLLFLNLYNVLFAVVTALYLFRLACLYVTRERSAVAYVLLSIYATFLWHYLRAPTTEVYHVCIFLAAAYHGLRFLRSTAQDAPEPSAFRHLAAAASLAGFLVVVKLPFLWLLLVLWPFALIAGPAGERPLARLRVNLRQHWSRYAWSLLLPTVVFGLAFLLSNWFRCGSPFESGYGQWIREDIGQRDAELSVGSFPDAFLSFVTRPGNYNVLLHYPLLAFALVALPAFLARSRVESAYVCSVALGLFLLVCFASNWEAGWCYGPRLQIHAAMLGSLPCALFIDRWILSGPLARRLVAGGALSAVAAWSLVMQIYVSSLPYFAYYDLQRTIPERIGEPAARSIVAGAPLAEREAVRSALERRLHDVRAYFTDTPHRGLISGDVVWYRLCGRDLPPLGMLDEMAPPGRRGWTSKLRPRLLRMTEWNYMLLF